LSALNYENSNTKHFQVVPILRSNTQHEKKKKKEPLMPQRAHNQ